MIISEFLEARIAEDEMEAKNLQGEMDFGLEACGDRMLAECEAKRLIIGIFNERCPEVFDGEKWVSPLAALATVYKDHPDYRQAWAL